MNRTSTMILLTAAVGLGQPALAQFNLAGTWSQLMHEDAGERGGGPAIGDYTGLPINIMSHDEVRAFVAGGVERARQRCADEAATGHYFPGCPVISERFQ